MPSNWVLNTALFFTAYCILLSIYIFIFPLQAALLFGLDAGPASVPFIRVFAGRNLALGLATSALYVRGRLKEMGVVFACVFVAGSVDTVVVSLVGLPGKALGHGIGTIVLGFIAWKLMN